VKQLFTRKFSIVWGIIALLIAAWLLWMTLRPQGQASADLAYITTPAAAQGISISFLIGFLGNIAVFVPLGAAVAFALADWSAWPRLIVATLAGSALSAAIELIQRTLPSRFSSWDDWLLNTLGALLGALVANFLIRNRKKG